MTQKKFLSLVVITLFALILAGMIALFQIGEESKKIGTLHAVGGDVGQGDWRLVNQNGEAVTNKDFAGQYKLIYFGFTYCPAICPTELSKMGDALNEMGTAARAIQPIFITIDPDRDTVPVMKNYISLFDPRLAGLSGTAEQVKRVADVYKVYYAKAQTQDGNDYTMDHSSYIYFMGPDDTLLHIFKTDDNARFMAGMMQAWLDQDSSL